MSLRRQLQTLSLCAVALLIAAPAFAQGQSPLPPPVDRSASIAARKQQQTAQAEVTKAQTGLNEVVAKLRSTFEEGDDWKAASAAQKEAQTQHDALRKPIIEAVKKKPAYIKAEADKRKAEEQLAEYRLSNVTGNPVIEAAKQRADASAEMNKLENDALNADPKYVEWKKKLQEANAEVAALKKQFDASMPTDMGYMEAKKALETAQEQFVTATRALTDALARDREAERARQEQIRQTQTRRPY